MKKQTLPLVILPALLVLSGCNNSSDNSRDISAKNLAKPAADYHFSESEKAQILNERNAAIGQSLLTYNNQNYRVKFATKGDDEMLLLLENSSQEKLSLLIPTNPTADSQCEMESGSNYYIYNCSKSQITTNDDIITLQAAYMGRTQESPQDGSDFVIEYHEEIGSIGSTELTVAKGGNNQATITTRNPFANNNGLSIDGTDLGVTTYNQLHESVATLAGYDITMVFDSTINGSADDEINMYTGLLIRNKQLDTKITAQGSVFSGGTDLFAAGVNRTLVRKDPNVAIEKNKQIGVHAWAEETDSGKVIEATAIPYSDKSHRKQATYFTQMLKDKGVDFYLYTIKAAPAAGGHYMTRAEMDKYNFVTQFN